MMPKISTTCSYMSQLDKLITPREAAAVLGITARQVRRLTVPGGPLEASRRDPILIDAAKVAAFKRSREVVDRD